MAITPRELTEFELRSTSELDGLNLLFPVPLAGEDL